MLLGLFLELPNQRMNDVSRELQLQSELYELRSDYSRVLEENEKMEKELKRVSKLMNENDTRLKYEFELEQLNQKNATLEKQLKKAKELRIRRESDEEGHCFVWLFMKKLLSVSYICLRNCRFDDETKSILILSALLHFGIPLLMHKLYISYFIYYTQNPSA